MPLLFNPNDFNRSNLTGFAALKHSRCTFELVSSPAKVVKSMQLIALRSHATWCSFLTVLLDEYSAARFLRADRFKLILLIYFSSLKS